MKKLTAWFGLFQRGKAVADPARWKNRQVTTTGMAGLIWAVIRVADAHGYSIPVSPDTVDTLAVVVLGVVNIVLTYTTSPTVGLPQKPKTDVGGD